MMSFSLECEGIGKGVDERWIGSCEDRQGPCDRVANRGSRCIGSECSLHGSVLHGGRRSKMILWR